MSNEALLSDSENDEDFSYLSDKEEDFSDSDEESRKLQRKIDAENRLVNQKTEVKVDKDAMRKIYEEMKGGGSAAATASEAGAGAEAEAGVGTTAAAKKEGITTGAIVASDTTSVSTAPRATASVSSAAANKVKKPKRAKKGSLLDAMNKPKKKLNTLEQSKADWNQFVDKEGIGHDLSHHNKDGYLEKRDFLDTH